MPEQHFIHLCQPDREKSCAACCGLYNYRANSRDSLTERLRRRTALFRRTVLGSHDLAAFSLTAREQEDRERIYEVIHCCEYVGFLDPEEKKVGCLLHPAQNRGTDLRNFSFYGQQLCNGHFCPSYHYISKEEKLALIHIIDDWYLFGLCITDIDLVKEYFRFISERIYKTASPGTFLGEPFRSIALRFFTYKIEWPFRSPDDNRFGKYAFDGQHYIIPYIDYEAIGCEKSRFDKMFLSLSSSFKSAAEIEEAERLIRENIDEFARQYVLNEKEP